jgi:CelD/BcsL family acetyltransferase involved in cellulose biosynthesis
MTGIRQNFATAEKLSDLSMRAGPLFAEAEQDSFDLGTDWFDLLIQHGLPDPSSVSFAVGSRPDGVCCILPLMHEGRRLRSLSTYYTSQFRPLMRADVSRDDLASLLEDARLEFGAISLMLRAMDPSHSSFALTLAALRQAGFRPFPFVDFANWYLPTDGVPYAAYFKRLSSRVRNTVRRRERRLIEQAGGRVRILSGTQDAELAVEAWGAIYSQSWKKPEPFPDFVPELIRLSGRRGWLRFGLAELGDAPIAAQIWIVNGGRAAIYKLAYDQAYASYSAGTILTAHLMRHVMDTDKVREVDYLIGDDAYKREWMTDRRLRMGIIAYHPSTLRGVAGIAWQSLSRLRQQLRGNQP